MVNKLLVCDLVTTDSSPCHSLYESPCQAPAQLPDLNTACLIRW